MKKSAPERSCTPFWSSATSNQMSAMITPKTTACATTALPAMGLRFTSLTARCSSTPNCTRHAACARGAAAAASRTSTAGRATISAAAASFCARGSDAAHAASSCAARAVSSKCAASASVSTCMKKKSAGLAYVGHAKPAAPKCATDPRASPAYTARPASSSVRSSNSAKMSDEGWWHVHTTVQRRGAPCASRLSERTSA